MPAPTAAPAPSRTQLARVCQKLVLRAKATQQGAAYTLFLRVALPESARLETYPLLPDSYVRLVASHVDPLNAAGQAPALSASAARAASLLGLGLSTDLDASDDPASNTRLPSVTTANWHICIVAPPSAPTPTSASPASRSPGHSTPTPSVGSKRGYLVTLRLEVPMATQPPEWPWSVRMPIPRCLNNKLHFEFDEAAHFDGGSEGIIVEMEPQLIPRSVRNRRGARASSRPPGALDDEGDDGSSEARGDIEEAAEDGAIQGPFPAAEDVVIRWAPSDAGSRKLPPSMADIMAKEASTSGAGPSSAPLRVARAESHSRIQLEDLQMRPNDEQGAEVLVDMRIDMKLHDLTFPGLESSAVFPLVFDAFEQPVRWITSEVTADIGLLRFSHALGKEQADLTRSSLPSTSPVASPKSSSSSSSFSPNPGHSNGLDKGRFGSLDSDDGDLLHIAPPKDLSASELDFSFDVGGHAARRKRRHSIGPKSKPAARSNLRGMFEPPKPEELEASPSPGTDSATPASVKQDESSLVMLYFDPSALFGKAAALVDKLEPLTIQAHLRFTIQGCKPLASAVLDGDSDSGAAEVEALPIAVTVPVLRVPATKSHKCEVRLDKTATRHHAFDTHLARTPKNAERAAPTVEAGRASRAELSFGVGGDDDAGFLFSIGQVEPEISPYRPKPGFGFDPEACVLGVQQKQAQSEKPALASAEAVISPISPESALPDATVVPHLPPPSNLATTHDRPSPESSTAEETLDTSFATTVAAHTMRGVSPGSDFGGPGLKTEEETDLLVGGTISEASIDIWTCRAYQGVKAERLGHPSLLLDALSHSPAAPRADPYQHVVIRFEATWPQAPVTSGLSTLLGGAMTAPVSRCVFAIPTEGDAAELRIHHVSVAGRQVQPPHSVSMQADGEEKDGEARTSSRMIELARPAGAEQGKSISILFSHGLRWVQGKDGLKSAQVAAPVSPNSITSLAIRCHGHEGRKLSIDGAGMGHLFTSMSPSVSETGTTTHLFMVPPLPGGGLRILSEPLKPAFTKEGSSLVALNPVKTALTTLTPTYTQPTRNVAASTAPSKPRSWMLHLPSLLALLLALLAVASLTQLEPSITMLSDRVDNLAMALGVDFADGSWVPPHRATRVAGTQSTDDDDDDVRLSWGEESPPIRVTVPYPSSSSGSDESRPKPQQHQHQPNGLSTIAFGPADFFRHLLGATAMGLHNLWKAIVGRGHAAHEP